MENWSFIDWILFGMFLWFLYQALTVMVAVRALQKRKIREQAEEIVKAMVIPAYLEHYRGQVFLYNKETGKFIVQATSEDELKTKLNQLFPRKAFIVVESTIVPD